jgi:hypothetical protein
LELTLLLNGSSMTEMFKYRAFLSYSHADTGVAMRVHKRLEGFHIDKELVGRVTKSVQRASQILEAEEAIAGLG